MLIGDSQRQVLMLMLLTSHPRGSGGALGQLQWRLLSSGQRMLGAQPLVSYARQLEPFCPVTAG